MYSPEQIREFVENNPTLVRRHESVTYPGLYVLKYTRRVFYDALWNVGGGILEELRGLVVDKDYNIVVMPFRKIYNRGENGTDIDGGIVVTYAEKINGFMGAITYSRERNEIIYSTTGSTDSDYAVLVEDYLKYFVPQIGWTWLFEICDPSDPHIIEEVPGAYLIGARNLFDGRMMSERDLDSYAEAQGYMRPTWGMCQFSQVVALAKDCKREGFVVYGDGKALKIKSPYYLTKKLFARIGRERICSSWLEDNRNKIDEEYYPLIDHIRENRVAFGQMNEQERLRFMEAFLEK